MDDLQHQQDVTQDTDQTPEPPVYPIGIEQLRLLFAKGIDPRDQLRVYLRLGAIGLGVYYLATGLWGLLVH